MRDVFIVSTARTPIGKAFRGAFNNTHGATLGAHVVANAVERAKLDMGEIDDVILGCSNPEGANGYNIARVSAVRAGLPVSVAGVTVNRFCASGLQAIAMAAQAINNQDASIIVAGGSESASCVRDHINRHMREEQWVMQNKPSLYMPMIETAEVVAKRYGISRADQDAYALRSQQRFAQVLSHAYGPVIGEAGAICTHQVGKLALADPQRLVDALPVILDTTGVDQHVAVQLCR